jgi:hypothetical protein
LFDPRPLGVATEFAGPPTSLAPSHRWVILNT